MGVFKYGVLAVALSACGTEKISQCTKDSDCTDIAYPFCDVDGQYSPSGGEHNVCTVTPSDCPIERCGCSPGATSCDGETLTTCNSDGMSQSMTTCSLGCSASKDKCASFTPSNGLGPALESGATAVAVTIPNGSKINTATGEVTDANGSPIAVPTVGVSQSGGPDIQAFYGASFDIGSVTVTGTKAMAIVAPGPIVIHGSFVASATGTTNGPGAAATALPCVGQSGNVGGGGGNQTSGGNGVLYDDGGTRSTVLGGVALATYSPLIGGCHGGNSGGGGGGGLQVVSKTSVVFGGPLVNLGGGGGAAQGGGGAGGTLVVEAPKVTLTGTIAANGGGAGGCAGSGQDATTTDTPATAGSGSGSTTCIGTAGNGATRSTAPGNGAGMLVGPSYRGGGAGGGAVGRMIIRTPDGTSDSTLFTPEIVVESGVLAIE